MLVSEGWKHTKAITGGLLVYIGASNETLLVQYYILQQIGRAHLNNHGIAASYNHIAEILSLNLANIARTLFILSKVELYF